MKKAKLLTTLIVLALALALVAPAGAQTGLPPICSGVQLQNVGTTAAQNVSMSFYKQGGNDGVADYVYTVAGGLSGNASKSFYIPNVLPSTVPDGIYAVVVSSDQKLNSLVNENTCTGSTPYVGASHSGVQDSDTGTTVYLGYVLSRAFAAGWSSALAIQNADTSTATNVKVEFFKAGSSIAVETFSNNDLKAGETWYLDLSTGTHATAKLNGFAGTAKITSDKKVAAVANYAPADGTRLLSYNGSTTTSQKLYASQITKFAFAGQYTSGITLYNPNGSATPISVQFIASGATTPVCTYNDTIQAYSSWIKYMGSITNCTTGSLPNGFNGTAVVNVTSGSNGILGIFNFDSGIGQAEAANMIREEDASSTLYFPQIVRNAFGGFQSGWQVVNTGTSNLNLTITYTRDNGSTYVDHKSINAGSALTVYVGAAEYQSSLGDNWNGGAVVSVDGAAGKIAGQGNITAPYSGDGLLVYNAFTP